VLDEQHILTPHARWNGATWQPFPASAHPLPSGNYAAIAARSFDDVSVAGIAGSYHWDGTDWTKITEVGATGMTNGLWIDPADQTWAAVDAGEVRTWQGSTSTELTSGDDYTIAVSGTSERDIWTLSTSVQPGSLNRVLHWNGTAWSDVGFPYSDPSYVVARIWATAPDDVWIAGGHRIGNTMDRVAFHWTGSTWTTIDDGPTPDLAGFVSVWGSSPTDVYLVSATHALHIGSGTATPPVGTDVFGTSANDVYIVDGQTLWHWDGMTWASKQMTDAMVHGWENAPDDIWLSGELASMHYDGQFFVRSGYHSDGPPVGTLNDMFLFATTIAWEWPSGFNGPMQQFTAPNMVPFGGGWHAPDGRVYAAGNGLIVHP
jgi:hypothetical protein